MTMDFDKIREQYAKMEGGKKSSSSGDFINKFYAIPEGNSVIRVLPSNDEDKLFYAETAIHRVPTGEGQTRNFHCRKRLRSSLLGLFSSRRLFLPSSMRIMAMLLISMKVMTSSLIR